MAWNVTTKTAIGNMALRNLGIGKIMTDMTTDTTEAGVQANAWYQNLLEAKLRNFRWAFATKFADLRLLVEGPTAEWGYLYKLPDDYDDFRRILSNRRLTQPWGTARPSTLEVTRQDTEDTQVPKLLISDMSDGTTRTITAITKATECEVTSAAHGLVDGQLVTFTVAAGMTQLNAVTAVVSDADTNTFKIKALATAEYIDSSAYTTFTAGTCVITSSANVLTDVADAVCEYGYICTDVSLFPIDFSISLAWDISATIGPVVVGQDKMDLVNHAMTMAVYWEQRARAKNKNEGGSDVPPLPAGVMARL